MLVIQLSGYNCIAQGKSSSERGGLIIYIDTKFKYEIHLSINTHEHWEGQMILVHGGGLSKSIIIGNVYRPPRQLREQINQFIT